VEIRCNAVIDMDDFDFEECNTVLRFIMDDCEKNPSPLCFNGVAYDISESETCTCGGVRFKEIDSCGNPLEWGPCLDLDSCTDVVKEPHTGAAITVKEDCNLVEQDCDGGSEYVSGRRWMVTMDSQAQEEDVEEDIVEEIEEPEAQPEEVQVPEPVLIEEAEEIQEPEDAVVDAPEALVEAKEPESNLVPIILVGVVGLLFLIVLISWVYVSYFKK
jgi:hypothetical protein